MPDADDDFDPDFVPLPLNAVPSVVWRISAAVLIALDAVLGDPVDTYVNGSQVWIDEDGPVPVEWRLHPIASYVRPAGMTSAAVFPAAVNAAGAAVALPTAGSEVSSEVSSEVLSGSLSHAAQESALDPALLWDGLEAFPAYHDAIDVAGLRDWCVGKLGVDADASGLVNHDIIADRWERSGRATSIVSDLLEQLVQR